jgi:shikimate kinase
MRWGWLGSDAAMDLIFLHGPVAAGKLTVARALAERTGYALFHNHLVVDAVGAVFSFGTPEFRRMREAMWLQMFEAAAQAGRSLIFTFAPEGTVSTGFPDETRSAVAAHGGRVRFIALTISQAEQDRRVDDASRAAFGKLRDPTLLRTLRMQGAFDYPALPAELSVDTSQAPAEQIAERIAAYLQV